MAPNFLRGYPFWPKSVVSICIHYDSLATIGRVGSVMYKGKSLHIRQRHNNVRQLLSSGIIKIYCIKSSDTVSHPLTKDLVREEVERSSKGMGL